MIPRVLDGRDRLRDFLDSDEHLGFRTFPLYTGLDEC